MYQGFQKVYAHKLDLQTMATKNGLVNLGTK